MRAREAYQRRDEVTFIDVREQEEWDEGHIEGSTHIPMGRIPGTLDALERDQVLVTVCRSGHRSDRVADYLTDAGFDAQNLTGGLQEWEAERLPLVRPAKDGR